jgi:hypothetical protein
MAGGDAELIGADVLVQRLVDGASRREDEQDGGEARS